MPNTHLVMPRTLSAPYAELLEAETPQTMTASDAPPNGTAAAAVAFARLLASGDHAMQPERSPITETPADHCPHGGEDLHRLHALRSVLLGTTTIPSIGITFQEAAERYVGVIAEHDGIDDASRRLELAAQWVGIENAVAAADRRTFGDCMAALKVFAHRASPLHDGDFRSPNVNGKAVFAAMLQTAARLVALHDAQSDEVERPNDPAVTAYTAWIAALEAEERLSREAETLDELPGRAAKLEEYEQARAAREEAEEAMSEATASTPIGALARFAYFTHQSSYCMCQSDIKAWQGAVGDILRLGALPLPAEMRTFGEGRFFGPIHRAAMSSDGIDPAGRSIALPSSLWKPAPELLTPADGEHPDADILALGRRRAELIDRLECPGEATDEDAEALIMEWKETDHLIMELQPKTAAGLAVQLSTVWTLSPEPDEKNGPAPDGPLDRMWLWTIMKNAERIGAGAQPAYDRQDADAPIFSAYGRWSQLMRECYAAKTDGDCERLSEQADEAALDVMTHEPATREGLATQVFVMLHLERGGTLADDIDIAFPTSCEPDDTAHVRAVCALAERVKRIGRRDVPEAPQDTLASLYTRWAEVRGQYLSDGLSDEESTALRAELDQIEDRLESEPVRCVADAVAKLGYFLTVSNATLDDGDLPNIDANGSTAWQRLLFAVEDGVERLAVDMRQPFIAMVTGLRHLMQRHVKLEEETDRQPGGHHDADLFAAYDALLDAMKVESALPEDMSDEEREPYENAMMAAADHLVTFAPVTPRGAAVLLRYLFLRACRTIEAEKAIVRGAEPSEEDLADFEARILWQVVKMLEALPAAANDQHQNADAFTDTVAAFEAEAPATLALPLEPTGRMVDAGASAAGITPAQFQAAYAAAVEALKLERAA